ncbi:hypothetical protein [Streptomyces sp. NPDC056105]
MERRTPRMEQSFEALSDAVHALRTFAVTLEPGKRADLVIARGNPLTAPP